MMLMALAAISFVGCKPKNAPEDDKKDEPKVTTTDVKLFYEVKLTGAITDYVKFNLRYIDIPDTNKISVKENIVADWKSDEFTVVKGDTAYYGIEPSFRATELFKQALTDEAKYKTMVESNSTLVVTMGYKRILSDGSLDIWPISQDSIGLSVENAFNPEDMAQAVADLERSHPIAHWILWSVDNYISSQWMPNFWDRH